MTPRFLLAGLGWAGTLFAQSPLNTIPTPPPFQWSLWTGCVTPNVFFDLNVSIPVTIQGLDVALDNQPGAQGTVEVWVTNPPFTSWQFASTNPGAWTLRGTGPVTAAGQTTAARVSLNQGIYLVPGIYGVAVRYVNVRALFLTSSVGQFFSTTEMTLTPGGTQSSSFTSAAFAGYTWMGRIHFLPGSQPHVASANTPYGSGCNTVNGSIYQRIQCSIQASTLNGRRLSLVPTATGYTTVTSTTVPYLAPTPGAIALPLADDMETSVALANPFPYPGGTTQTLWVNSNGFVSVASNLLVAPNTFTPFVQGLLDCPVTAWWSWHDYNPIETGSGVIRFEQVGAIAVITWEGVESWPGTIASPVINRSTFQFQFDTSTGQVNYVWQQMTPIGGSVRSDEHVIGFSPGGPSPDIGAFNVLAPGSANLVIPEVLPLRLQAAPQPSLGETVVYTTSNENGQGVGVFFFCVLSLPGISLASLGLPGCAAHVDIGTGVGNVIANIGGGTSMNVSLPIPASLPGILGLELFGQSVWLDPAANPFGATVSNGLRTRIGDF